MLIALKIKKWTSGTRKIKTLKSHEFLIIRVNLSIVQLHFRRKHGFKEGFEEFIY